MAASCQSLYFGPSFTEACPGSNFFLFMSLVDAIFTKTDDVADPCGRVQPRTEPDESYDFIVIGGGPGGSTTAARLAEVGKWKVLLLEAGIDEPTVTQLPPMAMAFGQDSFTEWGYKTEPEAVACQGNPEKRCNWPRAKILGGCGVHNGMKYTRGIPKNYNDWAAQGNDGWSYEDVLPIFKRSEGYTGEDVDHTYHGTSGPMTVGKFAFRPTLNDDILKAAEEIGLPLSDDLNGKNIEGFEIAQVNVRGSVRLSAARAFLRPQRKNPNLHIMLNSTVTKILINDEKEAEGVQFIYKNQTFTVKAGKEVILSAGTMNSPQILMLSGVGSKDVLDRVGIPQVHELPGVGKNLSNHVAFTMSFVLNKEKNTNLMNWQSITRYLLERNGSLASPGLQVRGRLSSKFSNPDGSNPNLFFTVSGLTPKCSTTGEVNAPLDAENPDAPRTITITPLNLQPLSRGYISLRSNNPLEAPIMVGNYFAEEEDMDTLLEAVRITLKFTNSTLLKNKYGFELQNDTYGNCSQNYEYDSDDYWKCAIGYSTLAENHQTSTCKMGPPTDPFAVVDNKLRVYGIKYLRIADASIMPKVVSGNTHASVVMIAERVVDFIKQVWL